MSSSIDSRSRRATRTGAVVLVSLALLAGMLATVAARPTHVLALSKVVDVTLPAGRTISGTILKKTGATTTAPAEGIDIQACLVSTTQYVCQYAHTALNGTYTVTQLVPGKYTVEIQNNNSAVNLQSGWYSTANAAHFVVASASATQVDVTLANKTGINATVPIGFKIGGIIHLGTAATSIAGVQVQVCSVTGFQCSYATTIAGGVYSAVGLAPGTYTVHANATGNYQAGYFRTGVTNAFTPTYSLATKLTITTANLTGKTFTLPVGFRITGFVKTTANVALPNAGVTVSGPNGYKTASTTATGAFTVEGLPAGSYQVAITNPYDQPTLGDVFYKSGVAGLYTWDSTAATTVVITTASKALGTIWDPVGRTISGKITRGAGVALDGASVSAIPVASSSFGFFFFFGGGSTGTAADGTWKIQGLRPTKYYVGVSPSDYPPLNVVGGYYRTPATGNYTRNVEQGTVVDVTTANKAILAINLPAGNTISGHIKTGAVAAQYASVTVYSILNTEYFYGYASTDATGAYSITGIPNGRFIVQVSAPYGENYLDGYYRNAPTANFTAAQTSATPLIFGDGTPPQVSARTPANAATGVSRLTNVTATFNEAVLNVKTTTMYLRKAGTTTNIAAVVTYDAVAKKATLNPSVTLAASTSYTVTIYDIYDATGNVVTTQSWTFKTGL